jgi:predicted O-methyltransferase YrrM
MYLKKKDIIIVTVLSLLFLIGSIIGWLVIRQVILLFSITVIVGILMVTQVENYRRIQNMLQQSENNYRQIESLFYLYSTMRFHHPLPQMRAWAVSPDFANILISLIRECKPRLVLEAGSGVSTLVTAYTLQEVGEGKVVSLDHDEQFAEMSAANIKKHGLQDIATVINASLKEVAIGDKSWLWYDTEQLRNLGPIDMLIIDGPPGITQRLARYPALPILFHQLSEGAVVLLDDALRTDEREIVKLWLKEFASFSLEDIDAEKGVAILRRQTSKSNLIQL